MSDKREVRKEMIEEEERMERRETKDLMMRVEERAYEK